MQDPTKYKVSQGSVQACIIRRGDGNTPLTMIHFGLAEYDSRKSVLTERRREQGQKVCDALNAGEIDEQEARRQLSRVF